MAPGAPLPSVLIPIRGLRSGKSRLASILSSDGRRLLNEYFLTRTIATAKRAGCGSIVVVSSDEDALHIASRMGSFAVRQASGDLNDGVAQGIQYLDNSLNAGAIIVPVDLPWMRVSDFIRIAERARDDAIVICPDRSCDGTNALFIPERSRMRFCFGKGSFLRHQEAARTGGLDVLVYANARVARDVDTPVELQVLIRSRRFSDLRDLVRPELGVADASA